MDFQLEYNKAIARSNSLSPGKYFLVFMLIAVSGNPLFPYLTEWSFILFAALLSFVAVVSRKPLISRLLLVIFAAFSFLFLLQYLGLEKVSIPANVNRLAKIYCGFLVMTIVGTQFRETFLRVMVFICAVSLVGWAYLVVQGSMPGLEFGRYTSLFFFNLTHEIEPEYGFTIRNSGMFWEPGAFQGYINLAILLYLGDFRKFFSEHKKSFLILSLALVTTQSTTGYIVYAFLMAFFIFTSIRRFWIKVFVLSCVGAAAVWGFTSIDFLIDKFKEEYVRAHELRPGDSDWSRSGAAIIAVENLKRHPYIGNGDLMESRYLGLGNDMDGSGNGFFGELNVIGIPAMLVYLFLLFRYYPYKKKYKFIFVFTVILLLQGESFLNYPIFYALYFIQYPPPEAEIDPKTIGYKYYKKYLKIAG